MVVAVCNAVERAVHVSTFGVGRGFLQRTEVVLARVLVLLLARQGEATLGSLTAIVCALVSVKMAMLVLILIRIQYL